MISTCDRIGGHRWRVWMGGGKEGVREKRIKEVNKTDGSIVHTHTVNILELYFVSESTSVIHCAYLHVLGSLVPRPSIT